MFDLTVIDSGTDFVTNELVKIHSVVVQFGFAPEKVLKAEKKEKETTTESDPGTACKASSPRFILLFSTAPLLAIGREDERKLTPGNAKA